MADINRLLEIMARLRDPERGCPWDLQQDFASIAPYTLEEAYEVDDAIRRGELGELRDELGDLLFQVVFHSHLASELGHFDFEAVVDAIADKLTRRHPHVFADAEYRSAEQQTRAWEEFKAAERAERASTGLFDGIPKALPALRRSDKLQGRAQRARGTQAPDSPHSPDAPQAEALAKLLGDALEPLFAEQALAERSQERGDESIRLRRMGELLFHCVGLARSLGVDPERALQEANHRFEEQARESD